MFENMTEEQALHASEEFIANISGPESGRGLIYRWTLPGAGLRVAELSFAHKEADGTGYGSSFMQSEPGHGGVLFAAERLILAFMFADKLTEPDDAEANIQEAKALLAVALGVPLP